MNCARSSLEVHAEKISFVGLCSRACIHARSALKPEADGSEWRVRVKKTVYLARCRRLSGTEDEDADAARAPAHHRSAPKEKKRVRVCVLRPLSSLTRVEAEPSSWRGGGVGDGVLLLRAQSWKRLQRRREHGVRGVRAWRAGGRRGGAARCQRSGGRCPSPSHLSTRAFRCTVMQVLLDPDPEP